MDKILLAFSKFQSGNGTMFFTNLVEPVCHRRKLKWHLPGKENKRNINQKLHCFLFLGLRIREFSQLTLSCRRDSQWKWLIQNGSANTIHFKKTLFLARKFHSMTEKTSLHQQPVPLFPCYVETRFVITTLIRRKIGGGGEIKRVGIGEVTPGTNWKRLFLGSVSISFVIDCSLEASSYTPLR